MPKPLSQERVKEIFRLNEAGYTYDEIAGLAGVSRKAVYNYVSRVNKQFYAKVVEDHDRERGRQLRLHVKGYRLCMDSYRKSCEDATSIQVVKEKNKLGEEVIRTQQTIKGQVGNTAHLTEARAHLASIREILMMKKVKETDDAKAGSPEVTSALQLLDEIARQDMKDIKKKTKSDL